MDAIKMNVLPIFSVNPFVVISQSRQVSESCIEQDHKPHKKAI